MPRPTRDEWEALDPFGRWLVATRSAVFLMTAVSCAIGALFAFRQVAAAGETFDGGAWLRFFLCMVGLVFAHATNNLVNDITDHLTGVDKGNYFRTQYGPQPLQHGLLSMREMIVYASITGLISASAGVALVWQTGVLTLVLMGIGAAFVLFYTWPLKHIGMGEPVVLAVWGPLMIGGTAHVITQQPWDWGVFLAAVTYGLGPTALLFGKHIDKLEADRQKKVRTLPVLLGESGARHVEIGMLVAQQILVVVCVVTGVVGWPLLVTLLAVPKLVELIQVLRKPRPTERPADFDATVWPLYLVAHTFIYNHRMGLLFVGGVAADVILRWLQAAP